MSYAVTEDIESLPRCSDDLKAYQATWMRNWRRNNPELAKERRRTSMRKWRNMNKGEKRKRATDWRLKWKGIPEKDMYQKLQGEFPNALSLDDNTPDFYDGDAQAFIEIKRALPYHRCIWTYQSKHFPGLYFTKSTDYTVSRTRTIDEQINRYPRPLIVVVYHALDGTELTRKMFRRGDGR